MNKKKSKNILLKIRNICKYKVNKSQNMLLYAKLQVLYFMVNSFFNFYLEAQGEKLKLAKVASGIY